MATSFRTLLNRVLINISEDEVDSGATEITETNHKLIRNFINTIKTEIEDSHNWSTMRKTCTATITAGNKYSSNFQNASNDISAASRLARMPVPERGQFLPLAFDVTTSGQYYRLIEADLKYVLHEQVVRTDTADRPYTFANDPSADAVVARFPNAFSTERSLQFEFYVPQDDFAGDTADIDTAINLPPAAIKALELGATWYAYEERGEELGTGVDFTETRYMKALDSAINRDDTEGSGDDYQLVPE